MSANATDTRTDVDAYPSRVGSKPAFLPRKDPVLHGGREAKGPFSPERLDGFERNGYAFVEELISKDEVEGFRAEMERLREDASVRKLPETVIEPRSEAVRSVFRVHGLSPAIAKLAADPRIAGIARQILGGPVYLHQTRINFKPGFGAEGFYWHSDFETWHVEDGMPRMRAVSFSINLTENFAHNGPVMVVPGSHKRYLSCIGETPEDHYKVSLREQEIGVPDPEGLTELVDKGGIAMPVGPAGSALVFDCNAMHGSNSNITPHPRSNLFFVYNSVENALVEPFCGLKPRPDYIASRVFDPV